MSNIIWEMKDILVDLLRPFKRELSANDDMELKALVIRLKCIDILNDKLRAYEKEILKVMI